MGWGTLTLDGVTLGPGEMLDHLEQPGRKDANEEWRQSLQATLRQLVTGRGSLRVMTSGTTGPPRSIALPRRDLISSAQLTARTFELKKGDRALLCLPCAYIAGKMMLVRATIIGMDLHVIDPSGGVLERLKIKDRFRFTPMVPLQLHRAIAEDRDRIDRQFDTILLGGGPVSESLINDVGALRTRIFQSYGSTETVTHVALRRLNGADRTDHYVALGDITFRTNDDGCLVIHTPHLTRKRHVTRDLVELLDPRRFRWLGRADHAVLSGGRKIFPEQLETRTAGIIPMAHYFTSAPDDRLGQCLVLVLETDRPADEVLEELRDRIMTVLGPHELPRKVKAVREIPRTASGKMIRS